MRVISGELGSRRIPFNNKKFGNARVTSDFVKEAVFGSLGPDLTGSRFLDLFAGSGQMGLEAVSRGGTAWLNDKDRKRIAFVEGLASDWALTDRMTLSSLSALKLISQLAASGDTFDIVYIDPPYDAVVGDGSSLSEACLSACADASILGESARLFVQHGKRTELPASLRRLERDKQKRYGDSLLSSYHLS